jgi:chromate reductase, NAD(P)H dehydrogenase (quinone)
MEKRNVLLICGSYHPRSSNRALLDVVEHQLRRVEGLRVDQAGGLDRLPALDPTLFKRLPPEVQSFREAVDRASAFVIAGPEYAGGLAGSLKNALDWCVGADRGFYRKVVVVMSAGTSGGAHALRQLIQTLLWQGAFVVGHLSVAGPKSKTDDQGRITDAATKAAIENVGAELISALHWTPSRLAAITEMTARAVGIKRYPHQETT